MEQKLELMENSIIPIYKGRAIDGRYEHEQLVNARELWQALGVGKDFSNWIKDRIEKYGFKEGIDFSPVLAKSSGGRPATEYILRLDTAKEIAMVENNEMGRTIRRYLIEVEKRYHSLANERAKAKAERRVLTDILKELIPESPHKQWVYKHYTDLVYRTVTGHSAKELRELYGLDEKANVRNHLPEQQLRMVTALERMIQGLLTVGMNYDEIKTLFTEKFPMLQEKICMVPEKEK